jgi:hypothetical protein
MTWLYNKTNNNALISAYLLHASSNAWTLLLLTNVVPGEAVSTFDTSLFILSTIMVFIAGLFTVLISKGKLGFKQNTLAKLSINTLSKY